MAQEEPLHDEPDRADRQGAQKETRPESRPQVPEDGEGAVRPQHVEAAVGEVQHPEDAEDQRQPAGHEPDEHPAGQSGEDHVDVRLHHLNGGDVPGPSNGGRLKYEFAGRTFMSPMTLNGYFGSDFVFPQGTS